ncbi:hypothetical protein AAH979_41930 [Plantactinospora sp. ZYX-F-223]|uniref:hypothetical protein n=1 Tax=Plantactinospora sp. ZYX-F-223 TaxID=3144103 RepID=UPI0031FC09BD
MIVVGHLLTPVRRWAPFHGACYSTAGDRKAHRVVSGGVMDIRHAGTVPTWYGQFGTVPAGTSLRYRSADLRADVDRDRVVRPDVRLEPPIAVHDDDRPGGTLPLQYQ